MNSGFYAACAGLKAKAQALEVLANNLANLNTTGYKTQRATFRSVLAQASELPLGELNKAINDFGVLSGTHTDPTAAPLERTGNSLDLGVEGEAYFTVKAGGGEVYTRSGNFHLSPQGQLLTSQGDPVLGQQGPITLPSGNISVAPDGTVSVNGAVAARLRLLEFERGTELSPIGTSNYSSSGKPGRVATGSAVRQGALEGSNVNPVQSLVELISLQRNAEMMQRALSSFYGTFDRIAVDDLPRL